MISVFKTILLRITPLNWNSGLPILQIHQHSGINLYTKTANTFEAGTVDCLSFQIILFHICPTAGLGCLSVYLLICLCETGSLFASTSVCLSGLLYPEGLGTLPALCHMISLEAAGVKLIWSGLKAYERLMLRINCNHLNCPLPPLNSPSCPWSPNRPVLANKRQSSVLLMIYFFYWLAIYVELTAGSKSGFWVLTFTICFNYKLSCKC